MHRDALAKRLADTEAAIAEGPTHAFGLCSRVFPVSETDQAAVWQLVEMIAYLRHLRLTGRIVRDEAGETFAYRLAG
jgi:hypothetical protein